MTIMHTSTNPNTNRKKTDGANNKTEPQKRYETQTIKRLNLTTDKKKKNKINSGVVQTKTASHCTPTSNGSIDHKLPKKRTRDELKYNRNWTTKRRIKRDSEKNNASSPDVPSSLPCGGHDLMRNRAAGRRRRGCSCCRSAHDHAAILQAVDLSGFFLRPCRWCYGNFAANLVNSAIKGLPLAGKHKPDHSPCIRKKGAKRQSDK